MNLISGFHSIINQIKINSSNISTIYIDNKRKDNRLSELVELCNNNQLTLEYVDSKKLDKIANNSNHQGIIAKLNGPVAQKSFSLDEMITEVNNKTNAIIMVLDGITDPHNLGAIIRTADCFGVDAIILPKDNSANINNITIAKTSSGAVYNIPIISVTNLNRALEKLKENEFWIAGTTLTESSISLFEFNFSGKLVWVLGNEGKGMRRLVQENCDFLVTIPMFGNTQSLNVSVASGIVLSYTRLMQHKNL
jgi:23S rRNA (guanosine2251-2'-O)-methyltransferase